MQVMNTVEIITIDTWQEFQNHVNSRRFKSWAFRGQRDANWGLVSSLSRYLKEYGVQQEVWPQQEYRILRIFRRKAHLLLEKVPDEDDSFEW